ncbi:hypothetical protein [Peribacillus sp. NPDC097295]|uniref:hypothetical protein n=1 Tax=Peribacillus sp. NPDC097295 TaxID=3364402 RepID=UPI003801FB0D
MKKGFFVSCILLLIVLSGCNHKDSLATISRASDSEHANTFKELNIGELFEFDLTLNHADKTWVTIWIEKYENGKKDTQPLLELSYGRGPGKVQEGDIGFGIIHTDDAPLGFLYAPNVNITPQEIENIRSVGVFTGWDYAIEEEKIALKEGKTQLLGAYRVSKGNSIRTYDLHEEHEVKKMIHDDKKVFLLKIKVDEL